MFSNPARQSEIEQVLRECATYVFTKELELDTIPDYRPLFTFWGKQLGRMHNLMERKRTNTIIIRLKEFFDSYVSRIFNPGYRAVAVKIELEQVKLRGIYADTIPVVLSNGEKFTPVFFTDSKTFAERDITARYGCALLSNTIGIPIHGYFAVKILTEYSSHVGLSFVKIAPDSLLRAKEELGNMIDIMSQKLIAPNTKQCYNCKFLSQCNL